MQIRRIELSQTLPIRQQVLWPDRSPSDIVYPEDSEADTFHLGAFDDYGELLGVATLYHDVDATWRLRGMGVLPDNQGGGIGTRLVDASISELKTLGATGVWCNARLAVTGFYQHMDWEIEGEEFEIPGVGAHYVMRYLISN